MTGKEEQLAAEIERIKKGGAEKYHVRNREQKKLFARDRLKLLLDDGKIEFEDGMFAECQNPELPADVFMVDRLPLARRTRRSKPGRQGKSRYRRACVSRRWRCRCVSPCSI